MSSFESFANKVSCLSNHKQIAFAVVCCERMLFESNKHLIDPTVDKVPFERAIDLAWQVIDGRQIAYENGFHSLALAINVLGESSSSRSPGAPPRDPYLHALCSAFSLLLHCFHSCEFAPRACLAISVQLIHLFDIMYDETNSIRENEREWRDRAIEWLLSAEESEVRRGNIVRLGDYLRDGLSDDFLDRAES